MRQCNRSMRGKFMKKKPKQENITAIKIAEIMQDIDLLRHELVCKCEQVANITCADVIVPKGVLASDQTDAAVFWWETKKEKWVEQQIRKEAYASAVAKLTEKERRLLGL